MIATGVGVALLAGVVLLNQGDNTDAVNAPVQAVAPASTVPPATAVAVAVAPPLRSVPVQPGEIAAARAALQSWAAFVAGRDPAALTAAFDPAGPQFVQLQSEMSWPAVPGYTVEVANPTIKASNAVEAVVAATVTWRRPGEAAQVFDWDMVLRPVDGGWRLWTVHQR